MFYFSWQAFTAPRSSVADARSTRRRPSGTLGRVRSSRHKPLIGVVTALFLAAHLVCVCTRPAFAAATSVRHATAAADPHACCHPNHRADHGAPVPVECRHCSHAALAAPDAQPSTPTLTAMPLFDVPIVPSDVALSAAAVHPAGVTPGHAPPLAAIRTTILQL